MKNSSMLILSLLSMSLLSACSSITDTIAASTQTFTNTTESTSRISSGDSSYAGLQNQQAVEFAKVNWMQLSANMARGDGEHLKTMADLLGVKPAQRVAFFSMTKSKFNLLYPSIHTTPEQLVNSLKTQLAHLS